MKLKGFLLGVLIWLQVTSSFVLGYPLSLSRQVANTALSLSKGRVTKVSHGTKTRIKAKLNLKDLAGSKDIDHAFEGVDIFLNFTLEGNLSDNNPSFGWWLRAAWPRGQVLFFPWFLDLAQIKGSLKARGYLDSKRLIIKNFKLFGPFSIEAKGLIFHLHNKIKDQKAFLYKLLGSNWQLKADVERAYNIFVRDAFSDSHPLVKKFKPQGKLHLKGKGNAIGIDFTGNILFKAKELVKRLAVRLSYPLSRPRCDEGAILWEAIYLDPIIPKGIFKESSKIAIKGKNLPVTLCHKSASLGPLRLSLGDGIISLESAQFLFERGTLVLKDLIIKDVKVHQLLKDVPLKITVNGHLPHANCQRNRLVFQGKIVVNVAKGTVEISDIWIEPYASIPRWGANIVFKKLDLRDLTENTSFGLVTGAVKGWIKGLVMSGGQPEAFDMLVETDESSKEPRKISITAIENLSILGGGGGSISFLGQLFKTFSYSRIGISCKLKNDIFELHGLFKAGDKEYLVKRGFWGGVNVINMNPKGKISFRDMLDRLKRIGESSQSKVEVK